MGSCIRNNIHLFGLLPLLSQVVNISLCEDIIRETRYGSVRGFKSNYSQIFLGIPYAKPIERWKAPSQPHVWDTLRDATKPAPMCYQGDNCEEINPVGACLPQMSEDCLYLNIYAPLHTTAESKKSVMLFIHGGGFEFSSGGADAYNGEVLSSKGDVVLVTINYRLGAFGFLVTDDISGNFGILDQIEAIKWVHENIESFGGDNARVTLFGQSAGAMSAAIHSTSDKVSHLFHKLIMESSPFTIPLKPRDVAVSQGRDFSKLLNCDYSNTTCLRSRSASEISAAQGLYFQQAMFSDSYLRKFLPWTPHIDGDIIEQGLMESFKTGSYSPKPTIIGTTSEEGQMYIYFGFTEPLSSMEYLVLLFGIKPKQSGTAYKMYKPENWTDARPNLTHLTTDFVFFCPARAIARELSRHVPVYSYVFNNRISIPGIWNTVTHCEGRVCHGSDVPYVFQSARKEPWVFTEQEFKLSDSIIFYWTNFAKTGNPNSFGQFRHNSERFEPPLWPPYQQHGILPELTLVLQEKGTFITKGYRKDYCDFWDTGEYRARK